MILILQNEASAKSSDRFSHADNSHKALLALLRASAASWQEIFHYKKWNLADGGDFSGSGLAEVFQ